jgi:hypothetical protein
MPWLRNWTFDRIAAEVVADVDGSLFAEEVRDAIEAVSTAEVAAHSGRVRGRGYVDPSEAAWELLDAAVTPFVDDVKRLVWLGQRGAAVEVGAGIVRGLADATGDDECAIFRAEERDSVMKESREADLPVDQLDDHD